MINAYFQSEKTGGQTALAIGILSCTVAGGIFLSAGAPFYTGLAIPLVLFGIVEVMVGASLTRRSDLQAMDLEKLLAESPAEFKETESSRMTGVMKRFNMFKKAEMACAALGLALILANREAGFLKGLGAGLLAQGLTLLVFDWFAARRGEAYLRYVKALTLPHNME
jgi:hypothetical protein